jgi:hypothetical protein
MISTPESKAAGEAYVALQQQGLSTSAIAKLHNVTRNSVCGLLWRTKHRLGIWEPRQPRKPKKPKTRPKVARPKPAKPVVVKAPPPLRPLKPHVLPWNRVAPLGTPAPIYELAPGGCRFAVDWLDGLHVFCNAPQQPQSAYCPGHHARAYTGNYGRP